MTSQVIGPPTGELSPSAPDEWDFGHEVDYSPVPGLFSPGGLTIFCAPPQAGKGALIASWVRAILDGGTVLGFPTQRPPKIGMLLTDRRKAVAAYWVQKLGVKPSEIAIDVLVDRDPAFEWAKLRKPECLPGLFEEGLDRLDLPPHSLLVVDTISLFLGGKVGDYSSSVAGIGPINDILARRKLTALGTHHTGKEKMNPDEGYKRLIDRALGSTAIAGYTDTQLILIDPDSKSRDARNSRFHRIAYFPRTSKHGEFWLQKQNDGSFAPAPELPASPFKVEAIDAHRESRDKVMEEIITLVGTLYEETGEAAKYSEIMDASQTFTGAPTDKTVQRYLRTLMDQGRIHKGARGLYYLKGVEDAK